MVVEHVSSHRVREKANPISLETRCGGTSDRGVVDRPLLGVSVKRARGMTPRPGPHFPFLGFLLAENLSGVGN